MCYDMCIGYAKGVRKMAHAETVMGKGKTIAVRGDSPAAVPFYSAENASHTEGGVRQLEQRRKKPLPLKEMKSFRRSPQTESILKNEEQ